MLQPTLYGPERIRVQCISLQFTDLQAGASVTHLSQGGYARRKGRLAGVPLAFLDVGWSIRDPPLTRWVCKASKALRRSLRCHAGPSA